MEIVMVVAGATVIAGCGLAVVLRGSDRKGGSVVQTTSPSIRSASAPPSKGIPLDIQYADPNGQVSGYRIEVLEVREKHYEGAVRPRLLVIGWCHLRRGENEFAVSRIEAIADPRTGEIYDKTDAIAGYLRLIASSNIATPDDRSLEGYREVARAKRDRKLILSPINATIEWRFSHGKGAPQSMRVWITAVALRLDGQAYALFAETIGRVPEERPYFINPLGSGHPEVLALEEEDNRHEGDAILRWAEKRVR